MLEDKLTGLSAPSVLRPCPLQRRKRCIQGRVPTCEVHPHRLRRWPTTERLRGGLDWGRFDDLSPGRWALSSGRETGDIRTYGRWRFTAASSPAKTASFYDRHVLATTSQRNIRSRWWTWPCGDLPNISVFKFPKSRDVSTSFIVILYNASPPWRHVHVLFLDLLCDIICCVFFCFFFNINV